MFKKKQIQSTAELLDMIRYPIGHKGGKSDDLLQQTDSQADEDVQTKIDPKNTGDNISEKELLPGVPRFRKTKPQPAKSQLSVEDIEILPGSPMFEKSKSKLGIKNEKKKAINISKEKKSKPETLNIYSDESDNEISDVEKKTFKSKKSLKNKLFNLPKFNKGFIENVFYRFLPATQGITIGIDIGPQYIKMVKTANTSHNTWEIIDYKSIPLGNVSSYIGDKEFVDIFRQELTSFTKMDVNPKIWVTLPLVQDNIFHIRIPKVSSKDAANAVYWTVKKDNPFEDEKEMLDFELRGTVTERGIKKSSVMAYTVPIDALKEIKELFSIIKFPLEGITIKTFAIQNIFRTHFMPDIPDTIIRLFIGNDFSRIDIYSNGELAITRDIKTGIESIIEAITEHLNEERHKMPEKNELNVVTSAQARQLLLNMGNENEGSTVNADGVVIERDTLMSLIEPVLSRIIRQVERTIKHYSEHVSNEEITQLYISSIVGISNIILKSISDQLGLNVLEFSPISPENINAGVAGAIESVSERNSLVPALGISLSNNERTPNLLFTYKDREKDKSVKQLNKIILTGFMVIITILFGIYLHFNSIANSKKKVIQGYNAKLSAYNPNLNTETIRSLLTQYNNSQSALMKYADSYQGLAIISDLSGTTPDNIKLTSLKINLGGIPGADKGVDKIENSIKDQKIDRTITISGFVIGSPNVAEAALSDYVVKLNYSPIFKDVDAKKASYRNVEGKDMLEFNINMKVRH